FNDVRLAKTCLAKHCSSASFEIYHRNSRWYVASVPEGGQLALHRSQAAKFKLLPLLNRTIDDQIQQDFVRSIDLIPMGAHNIIYIARECQPSHIVWIGVKHAQNVAVE